MISPFRAKLRRTHVYSFLPSILGSVVCFSVMGCAALAQESAPTSGPATLGRLSLKAGIVLAPKFCSTKKRQSVALKDVLKVGKAMCEQLYPALAPVFSDLQRLDQLPSTGSTPAQVTLIPRFVEISATQQPFLPSSQRKLVILLEWTIQDPMGNKIWLQTVQGSAERKAGWMVTNKGVSALVDAAVGELVKESVAKISAAPELLKLSR